MANLVINSKNYTKTGNIKINAESDNQIYFLFKDGEWNETLYTHLNSPLRGLYSIDENGLFVIEQDSKGIDGNGGISISPVSESGTYTVVAEVDTASNAYVQIGRCAIGADGALCRDGGHERHSYCSIDSLPSGTFLVISCGVSGQGIFIAPCQTVKFKSIFVLPYPIALFGN